jgi:sortase (surface protein transpeptidase)
MAFSAGCFIIFITIVNDMVKNYCNKLNKRITEDKEKKEQEKQQEQQQEQEDKKAKKNTPRRILDYDPYSPISIGFY